jgi:muramoyltetrapeptide carboxypeptidase
MKCSALAFGQFTCDISRKTTTPKRDVAEILKEYAMRSSKPSVGNIMYGHTAKKLTLPLGVMCSIEASRKTFSVDEAGVI